MKNQWPILLILCFFNLALSGQTILDSIANERTQALLIDEMLEDRMTHLLPKLMQRTGIDMWILISREYNEDPIMKTMLPSTWLSARRRTIMVFYLDPETGLDRIAIARYSVGKLLKGEWDIDVFPDQWEALNRIITTKDPKQIALNYSTHFALADGMVKTEYEALIKHLPEKYQTRVTSAENLAIGWLETRTEKELEWYPTICAIGHQILQEAFSSRVIKPGITTTEEVIWWLRQRVTDLGLSTWFHPSVSIQRVEPGKNSFLRSFSKREKDQVIRKGDLLHVDFGITYLRLNSDQQQHFYVLKDGETAVPAYLQNAFDKANRVQEILTTQFTTGKSGNDILKAALAQAEKEGIEAAIYTHPIGFHGHGAGPTIGMWDQQEGVKGNGDYPLYPNTAYSIELFAASIIPEWGDKLLRIMLEENGYFTGNSFKYFDGRAKQIFSIPRN